MICDRCLKEITLAPAQADNSHIEQVGNEWVIHYGDGTRSGPLPSKEFAEGMRAQEVARRASLVGKP